VNFSRFLYFLDRAKRFNSTLFLSLPCGQSEGRHDGEDENQDRCHELALRFVALLSCSNFIMAIARDCTWSGVSAGIEFHSSFARTSTGA